jgi:hypothetical protein
MTDSRKAYGDACNSSLDIYRSVVHARVLRVVSADFYYVVGG